MYAQVLHEHKTVTERPLVLTGYGQTECNVKALPFGFWMKYNKSLLFVTWNR